MNPPMEEICITRPPCLPPFLALSSRMMRIAWRVIVAVPQKSVSTTARALECSSSEEFGTAGEYGREDSVSPINP